MSTGLVKQEIMRFLRSPVPEVLCVRGKWGVGKTFSWKRYLLEASQTTGEIGLDRYAYVSLFGVNSLDQLKYSIFEATVRKDKVANSADLDSLKSTIESAGRKYAWLLNLIPGARHYFTGSVPAFFLMVRNQIVCIDDLERKGSNLDAADVLGLISFLKEERGCKIVLILNDEALEGQDKKKFDIYFEKVVDVSLRFDPSAKESVSIALTTGDAVSQRVGELCIALGISNIRIIKNIERDIRAIEPLLAEFDEEVFRQIASSLALFGWSKHQPGDAPTLDYLTTKKAKSAYGLHKAENLEPHEAAWNALLDAYGYVWTDELDLVLIDGVKGGYFDPDKVRKHAKELDEKVKATKAEGSFENAWNAYHDSFDDNENQVLDTIHQSFMKNVRYITPLNLSGTVNLFRELGRSEQASEMIRYYVANRNEDRKFFDLEEYPFAGDITDSEIREAFRSKCATLEDTRDVPGLLLGLKDGWDDDMLVALSTAPVEQYYRAFKQCRGKDLRKMLSGALQFDRISNASAQMREISRRGKEALKLIGKESPINARRVSKLGISVNDTIHSEGATVVVEATNVEDTR